MIANCKVQSAKCRRGQLSNRGDEFNLQFSPQPTAINIQPWELTIPAPLMQTTNVGWPLDAARHTQTAPFV
jgi:hypothetical protein